MDHDTEDTNPRAKESLRLYLDRANHFIDLESRSFSGETYLLAIIRGYANTWCVHREWLLEKTSLLLRYGADIQARDGNNAGCFQVLFDEYSPGHVVKPFPNKHFYLYVLLLLEQGGDVFAPDRWGISPTAKALASGLGTLWFRALIECSLHYNLTSVLAEDHAMWHKWREIESSHEGNQHEKCSGQRDTTEPRDESNSAIESFADSVHYGYTSSRSTQMQFFRCSDQQCGWTVWNYLQILSTTPGPTRWGTVIIDWAINRHTHEFLSQSTYFCGCIACHFSHTSRRLDEESDDDTDPMDDDLEKTISCRSISTGVSDHQNTRCCSHRLNNDSFDAAAAPCLRNHPCLESNKISPIASVSDH